MAPPRKPIATLKATGSYRPGKHGEEVVLGERVVELPAAPAYFGESGRYVDAWNQLAELTTDSTVLRSVDLPALEMMSVSLATFREACEILERDGDYVASPNGYAIAHPAVAIRNKAAAEFRAWAGKFGLTPSDRVSLGLGVVKGRSMADALEARIGRSPRALARKQSS